MILGIRNQGLARCQVGALLWGLLLAACCMAEMEPAQPLTYASGSPPVDLGVGLWAWPLPMDFDQDGDLDLVVACPDKPYNGTYFFENRTGQVTMPIFQPPVRIGPGPHNLSVSYVDDQPRVLLPRHELVDFRTNPFAVRKKLSTVEIPARKSRANQWKLCDFNGDGTLDLIVGVGEWSDYGWDNAFDAEGNWTRGPLHGYVHVLLNQGTDASPEYAASFPLTTASGPVDVYGCPSPNFEDFDRDGDLDLVCGEFLDGMTYFQNIGSRTNPAYAAGVQLTTTDGQPLTMDLQMIVPTAIDWDRDGDVDLIVGEEDGRVAFVEQVGLNRRQVPLFAAPRHFRQQADLIKFGALVTPDAFDWDGDGDQDLICGNTAGYIAWLENLDGGDPPQFAPPERLRADGQIIRIQAGPQGSIQGPCEAKWGYTTQTVADWDHDGLPDLIVNSIWGKVVWYRNCGTRRAPQLAAAQPVRVQWPGRPAKPAWNWWHPEPGTLVSQWRTTPVAIDWNRDGLTDLIMLDHEGYLCAFLRMRAGDEAVLMPGRRLFVDPQGRPWRLNARSAGGSGRRKLAVVDWDGDGRLDILANSTNADLYRNLGYRDGVVVLQHQGPIHPRRLSGHTTSPTSVDWNGDHVPDLLIGAEDGHLYYARQIR